MKRLMLLLISLYPTFLFTISFRTTIFSSGNIMKKKQSVIIHEYRALSIFRDHCLDKSLNPTERLYPQGRRPKGVFISVAERIRCFSCVSVCMCVDLPTQHHGILKGV